MEGIGVLREQTKRFIAENPIDIVFTRNVKTPDGAGGTTSAPVSLEPQTVRVIQQASAQSSERRTVSGEMTTPDYKVLTEWDADIAMGDTFEWRNLDAEIVWIIDMPYERTAEIAVR